MALHALVLESSCHVQPDPSVSRQPAKPADSTIQSDSTQVSAEPKCTCLAPRASAIKEQGFSEAVAARLKFLKESQPDQSMKQSGSYLQSGATVIR